MKTNWLFAFAIIALAGCSGEEAPAPDATATPQPQAVEEVAQPEPAEAGANGELYAMVPGLRFGIPLNVVEGKTYTPEGSTEERQGFTLEYSGMDAGSVMTDVRDAFVAAGYSPVADATTDEAGAIKQNFSKQGEPTRFVAVYPPSTEGDKTKNGRVWISWKLSGAVSADQMPVQD